MASSNYEWKNKLPIGFQFVPTDKELNMYLKLKSCNGKIPPGIFSDLDIYDYEPQQLNGIVEKHWGGRMYIFTQLQKKHSTGKKIKRTIHSGKGFWKASQARKEIPKKHNLDKQTCESSFQLAKEEEKGDTEIGTKTSLVYYESLKSSSGIKGLKSSSAKKTSWLMSEYRFPEKLDTQPLFNETDHELTLCVIYYNDTKKGNDGQLAMLSESDPIPPQIPPRSSAAKDEEDQSVETLRDVTGHNGVSQIFSSLCVILYSIEFLLSRENIVTTIEYFPTTKHSRRSRKDYSYCGAFCKGGQWGKRDARLRIGSWNIETLTGKSIELVKILKKRRINIACVQETKWVGPKAKDVDGYKLWFLSRSRYKNRVGILVDNEIRYLMVEVRKVNDMIIVIKLVVGGFTMNIISAYAPHAGFDEEEKRRFMKDLDEVVDSIPPTEKLFVGGDFIRHIGSLPGGYDNVHGGLGMGESSHFWSSLELLVW
ncbi:hypothetical protein RND71_037535 [Anisodus tanguticus]|uniref:NAC domain-containing protein n=1 Tax=Anisodus tanguticus TaxID=243964 RepID=A0AAE1UYZ1_9SOLA|nr:hypothetical protein RND71_037535 [Anisodus tanguticus]